MMVDGAEESQFKGPIDLLAPYTTENASLPCPAVTVSTTVPATPVFLGPPGNPLTDAPVSGSPASDTRTVTT